MEYRDRAIAALHAADQRVRADLRTIIVEAVAAEAYADVASIARIAGALSNLLRQLDSDVDGGESESALSAVRSLGAGQPDSVRAVAEGQKRHARKGSPREQYPQFLRDGDRLVKVAWSKKERGPYEHRAPRAVIQALVNAVQKNKGEGKLFQAGDVMPLKNSAHEEYPSYQSYLALNWLREIGVIRKKGREGYILQSRAATTDKLERLWAGLPLAEPNG